MLAELARDRGGDVALDDGERRLTFAQLFDRATRAARLLLDVHGLRPDDRAALLMHNRAECIELVLGALLAGVWIVPLNWHLAPAELDHVLADSGARVLFVDEAHRAHAARSAGVHVHVAGPELDDALAQAPATRISLDGPPGGTMIYTSGTTGRPKGVRRARQPTLAAAAAAIRGTGQLLGLDGSGPHLVTGPLYHAAPLLFALYDLLCGAPLIVMPRWDEREALRLIDERRVAHLHLVPTMMVRLLRLPDGERARFDGSSLSVVMHGAAPVAVDVKRRMIDWWGPKLVEYWGATEGGVYTLATSEEWLSHPGTVGRASPNYEVFAVDDAGRRLPHGEIGMLCCRHLTLPRAFEYHQDPEKTARSFVAPATFSIGDLGRVEADGFVYLSDRRAHLIISGGANIYPAEVEQVLARHPAVADCAVFGIPDAEWGESVKAAVELTPGHSPSAELERALIEHCGSELARYKLPRSIDFEQQLPRAETGKLYVQRLKERYWK